MKSWSFYCRSLRDVGSAEGTIRINQCRLDQAAENREAWVKRTAAEGVTLQYTTVGKAAKLSNLQKHDLGLRQVEAPSRRELETLGLKIRYPSACSYSGSNV